MSDDATLIADLVRSGLDPELVQRVAKAVAYQTARADIAERSLEAERGKVVEKRARDAERKRNMRPRISADIRGHPRKSADGADPLKVSPTPPSYNPSPRPPKGGLPPTGAALADRFDEFAKAYPKRGGSDPTKPARRMFEAAVKAGTDPGAIIAGAKRYAEAERALNHIGTELVCQRQTWLRQKRWQDYAGEDDQAVRAKAAEQVFVRQDDPAWPKVAEEYRRRRGKAPPIVNGGWHFEREVAAAGSA